MPTIRRLPGLARASATILLLLPGAALAAETSIEAKLLGMNCQSCANKATEALEDIKGVKTVAVDLSSESVTVTFDDPADQATLRKAIAEVDLEILFPGEAPTEPLTDSERAKADIAVATTGKKIDLEKHTVEGKFTIFDFTAEWCKPCKVLSPKLERMALDNDSVALRFVDIVDWKSDMAKEASREFGLEGIPYVRVYGPDGKFVGDVTGLQPTKVAELVGLSSTLDSSEVQR